MALNKTALKNGIVQLMTDMRTRAANADDEFATRLSDLIDDFVKSGDGIYQTGTLQQSGSTAVISVTPTIVKIQ
ncbi:MAG: hypothetical protein RL172_2132 [Bacteroidota bacterium]|jgi:hypothetical protein